jgi:hypothetical protein
LTRKLEDLQQKYHDLEQEKQKQEELNMQEIDKLHTDLKEKDQEVSYRKYPRPNALAR